MAETATIHALLETNASDIPAMLRQAADSIETEEAEGFDPTRAMVAVQIGKGAAMFVFTAGAVLTAMTAWASCNAALPNSPTI